VFQQATAQVRAWRQRLSPRFQISVNKSPVQFHHDGAGRTPWADQLQAQGLAGDCIVVEITEGLLLNTSSNVAATLLALRDAGIRVSLDDFGTGYSSLSYLQRLPIDVLKIDRSFITPLGSDQSTAIVRAIIAMAHSLDLRVVAEGVETERQLSILRMLGCDIAQGYLYSKPLPAETFMNQLLRQRA
jgi:EAL domain-containing protein (putative c-di-GMP-specific phosphodiesterase class I)